MNVETPKPLKWFSVEKFTEMDRNTILNARDEAQGQSIGGHIYFRPEYLFALIGRLALLLDEKEEQ